MSKKYNQKKSEYTYWGTRLDKEDTDTLFELGKHLKKAKLIKKVSIYAITRFALLSLLKTLENKLNEKKLKKNSDIISDGEDK